VPCQTLWYSIFHFVVAAPVQCVCAVLTCICVYLCACAALGCSWADASFINVHYMYVCRRVYVCTSISVSSSLAAVVVVGPTAGNDRQR